MAEGLLDGVLGGEEEKIDATVVGAEPLAAAIATNLVGQNPEVAARTAAFFEKQTEVLEVQKKNLEAEYEFFESEAGPRLLALRLRTAFQVFFALVATVIGIGSAIVIYGAVKSHRVVVDSFEISPNLATQALSGRIVAAGLHDRLTQLQATTRTSLEKREISSAWTNDIAIEVPETGISIGQLDRMLRTHFGHDQHISGSLIATGPTGFALTVRGTGILPKTFADEKGDLEALLTRAAEYVYGEAQPGLFIHYLANDSGRYEDAIAFAKSHLAIAGADDKAMLLNYWANSIAGLDGQNTGREVLLLHREAVRIKPDYWTAIGNIANDLYALGDEEGSLQVMLQMTRTAGGRPGKAPEDDYSAYDSAVYNLQAWRAAGLADLAATGGVSNVGYAEPTLAIAQMDVQLHEVDTARLRLETAVWNPKSPTNMAQFLFTQALLAEEVGDLVTAAKSWDSYAAQYADRLVSSASPPVMCWAAPTYEKTAQPAKSDAALSAPLKATGISTYVDCYRFKGDVLALRGDWPGAQQWYAKAVQLVPGSPAGYYSWGLALLTHGDLAQAAEKLQLANQKGPTWADPLKAWGDVLLKQGNAKGALAKYDEALKYAPNWKQLKEAREAAAKLKT